MKIAHILILLLMASLCPALQVFPGSGQAFPFDVGREYSFAYHTWTDDYHFYGTDVWAVRFDFRSLYPGMTQSEFSASKALIYLPQATDSVRVELFSDAWGAPGSSLAWAEVAVTTNRMEIPFSSPAQEDTLWLVVSYATGFSGSYVSAAAGGGNHSYYWNTNAPHPYFQSLENAGFNAELLFGLAGDFVLSAPDLELLGFDLQGEIKPRETVGPVFSVYNHSDQTLTDAVLDFNLYSPSPDFAFFDSIPITEPIPPRSLYQYTPVNPGYASHQFSLPDQPLQFKLRAEISCASIPTDTLLTNVKVVHKFSFEHLYPAYLAENFLRWDDYPSIYLIQDQHQYTNLHRLEFFPILSDSLGSVAAQIRFNWYGFNSLPRTVCSGEGRINGFSPDFASQYQQMCEEALGLRTFVSSSDCRLDHIVQNDLLTATITLTNANTLLYSTATEYNLVAQSVFSLGLFRKLNLGGTDRWIIDRWIAHAIPLGAGLGIGEEYSASFNIPLNNLSLYELNASYRLYYWIQLADGDRILYSAWKDFSNVVAVQDELLPVPQLQIWGNPLRPDGKTLVKLSSPLSGLSVYNLRGQKILELRDGRQIELRGELFPASGVYILRAATPDRGDLGHQITKLTVFK